MSSARPKRPKRSATRSKSMLDDPSSGSQTLTTQQSVSLHDEMKLSAGGCAAAVWFLGIVDVVKASTTFNLYYDGIVSSQEDLLSAYSHDGNKSGDPFLLPLLSDLSSNIMQIILHAGYGMSSTVNDPFEPTSVVVNKGRRSAVLTPVSTHDEDITRPSCKVDTREGVKCFLQRSTKDCDMDVDLSTRFHRFHDDIALRAEVTLTTPTTLVARESLVQLVPKLDSLLQSSGKSKWTIRHQPSIFDTIKPDFVAVDSSVTAAQEEKDRRAASVEQLMLGNHLLKNRARLDSTHFDKKNYLEVWSHEDVKFWQPVKSLFINGYLAATTAPAGNAHSEALVHPAVVSHPSPTRVLVISLTPNPIVKEVLKYASIEHVSVVGSNSAAMELVGQYMPALNDCNFLTPRDAPDCMKSKVVEVINEEILLWISRQKEGMKTFDVVVVDVPIGSHDWLSAEMNQDLLSFLTDDGILALSTGSSPSFFDVDTETHLSPRENLLRHSSKGSYVATLYVHDEPLAQPLSSTVLTWIIDDKKDSHKRFVRYNTAAIDVDLVDRFHSGIEEDGQSPTVVYDGPTHASYLTPSRAWDNWYCKTLPGRNHPICREFLTKWMNASFHFWSTEVKRLPTKGLSLFATEDVPAGHFVLPNDAAFGVYLDGTQWNTLKKAVQDFPDAYMLKQFHDFIEAYGFEPDVLGRSGWVVSFGNNTFTNHACTAEEETVSCNEHIHNDLDGDFLSFNPPISRRSDLFAVLVETSRDVKAGEELTQDYHSFREDIDADPEFYEFLHNMCEGNGGLVPN